MAFILYDEEEVLRSYIESERYEAAQEAEQKVLQEIAKKTAKTITVRLLKTGKLTSQEIAVCVPDISLEEVEKIQKELL